MLSYHLVNTTNHHSLRHHLVLYRVSHLRGLIHTKHGHLGILIYVRSIHVRLLSHHHCRVLRCHHSCCIRIELLSVGLLHHHWVLSHLAIVHRGAHLLEGLHRLLLRNKRNLSRTQLVDIVLNYRLSVSWILVNLVD